MIQAGAADLTEEGILTEAASAALQKFHPSVALWPTFVPIHVWREGRNKADHRPLTCDDVAVVCSDYIAELQPEQKAVLHKAMEEYEEHAKDCTHVPVVDTLLRSVAAWKTQVQGESVRCYPTGRQ